MSHFLSCPMIDKIYSHFKPFLLSLYPYEITLEEKAFGIYREITNRTTLRNYLTYQIRIVTFRNRNINTTNRNVKQFLIESILKTIDKDIKERYIVAKHKDQIQFFEDSFLIENIIAVITNGKIILRIK